MNNILRLTYINLLTFFGLDKIVAAKTKEEKVKASRKLIAALAIFILIGVSLYGIANTTVEGFILLNIPKYIFVQYMALSCAYILMINIFRINGTLFNYKDYDLLFSLPITKRQIIISKLILLYMTSFIYTLLFMIPAYIAYLNAIPTSLVFNLLFMLTLFIMPIVPLIISLIVGTLISYITSKFKKKTIVTYILTLGFVFVVMYFSYSMDNASAVDYANIGKMVVNTFNRIYPLAGMYLSILQDYNIISLLWFILIPLVLSIVYLLVLEKVYNSTNEKLKSNSSKSNYKIKNIKYSTPTMALYKKEFKKFITTPNWVINSCFGVIMMVLGVILLIISGPESVEKLFGIPGISSIIYTMAPIILAGFCALNCTTNSSISLEGKHFWILKSLPVKEQDIFKSKILVNLTVLVPAIILSATVLGIYLKVSLVTFIFMIITPLLYSFAISMIGLLLNIIYYDLNWKYEIKVIKNSLPVFITLFIGFGMFVLPFVIKHNFSTNIYIGIISGIVLILDIIIYIILNTFGVKKFAKIS